MRDVDFSELAQRIDHLQRGGMTYGMIARRLLVTQKVAERVHRDWLRRGG